MGGEDGGDVYLPQSEDDEATPGEPLVEVGHNQRRGPREAGEKLCVCVCVCVCEEIERCTQTA